MATLITLVNGTTADVTDVNSNFSAVNTEVRGVAVGGTGQSSYTTGDILYASASTTLSKLAAVTYGRCLISGGAATAPLYSTAIQITTGGSVRIGGGSAIATDATAGQFTLPIMSGTPTGVPEQGEGAMVIDTSNNRIYVRSNGAWRFAGLT